MSCYVPFGGGIVLMAHSVTGLGHLHLVKTEKKCFSNVGGFALGLCYSEKGRRRNVSPHFFFLKEKKKKNIIPCKYKLQV